MKREKSDKGCINFQKLTLLKLLNFLKLASQLLHFVKLVAFGWGIFGLEGGSLDPDLTFNFVWTYLQEAVHPNRAGYVARIPLWRLDIFPSCKPCPRVVQACPQRATPVLQWRGPRFRFRNPSVASNLPVLMLELQLG